MLNAERIGHPMSWIDDGDYFGPDRRLAHRLRLRERRRRDSAHAPPSLGALLRKLHVWASGIASEGANGISRYRARVQTVAKLANERDQPGVAACLRELDRELEDAQAQGRFDVVTLSYRCLHTAIATLNQPVPSA
jgi:hypothetical protein